MLNIEFWKDRLKDLHADHCGIGIFNGVPELCTYADCRKCDFSKNGCSGLFDWLCSEYKEPEIDWEKDIDWMKVPKDTEVLVRNTSETHVLHRRRFAVYVPRSGVKYRTFNSGEEQKNSTSIGAWNICMLANEEDIEKYRKRG